MCSLLSMQVKSLDAARAAAAQRSAAAVVRALAKPDINGLAMTHDGRLLVALGVSHGWVSVGGSGVSVCVCWPSQAGHERPGHPAMQPYV